MTDEEHSLRRRIYRNPPVIEGIARFQWSTPAAWSFTTPGLLYEQLRDVYPGEPTAHAQIRAGMIEGVGAASNAAGLQLESGPQRFIYATTDGSRRVGVGPTDVSVHGLPPYEGWESMTTRLQDALDATAKVLGGDSLVELVGLRYVNRVLLNIEALKFDDFLTITLGYPKGFPQSITGFLDRVEMEYEGELARLAFTWASTEAPPGSLAFILDLDLHASPMSPVSVDEAFEVLEDLKVKEGRAFEALLTDRLRSEFDEID